MNKPRKENSFQGEQAEYFTTSAGDMVDLDSESQSLQGDLGRPNTSTDSEFYSEDENAKPKEGKRLSRAKAKKARRIETAKKHAKGPTKPMREIQKTIDHILWDDRLDETEWLVGYEDRHNAQMLEKPLLDWKPKGGKLKDETEEEFTPLTRIQYLRRKSREERYWDRGTRTDRIEELAGNAVGRKDQEEDSGEEIEDSGKPSP